MATQYSQSTKNLPPVSYIKSLDIWMITCMVYVFAALLEFSIVYHVHYRRAKSKMQSLVSTTNGQSQAMAITRSGDRIAQWMESWKDFWKGDTAIDEASRVLFPLTYFSFVTGYFVMVTRSQQEGTLFSPKN
ncbi:glutamate-gated chloride channel alpha-like [Penaeus indicus]|uniref:glutamate-gated chloride channel alpha-like n=1 Tax=Penaeus indicus TaxID=29960 RepID=UPI00300C5DD7